MVTKNSNISDVITERTAVSVHYYNAELPEVFVVDFCKGVPGKEDTRFLARTFLKREAVQLLYE